MKNTNENREKRAPYMKVKVVDVKDNLFYRRPISFGSRMYVKYNHKFYKILFDCQENVYFLADQVESI